MRRRLRSTDPRRPRFILNPVVPGLATEAIDRESVSGADHAPGPYQREIASDFPAAGSCHTCHCGDVAAEQHSRRIIGSGPTTPTPGCRIHPVSEKPLPFATGSATRDLKYKCSVGSEKGCASGTALFTGRTSHHPPGIVLLWSLLPHKSKRRSPCGTAPFRCSRRRA